MTLSDDGVFRILHIDSSARSGISGRDRHGSHTRRLSRRFIDLWSAARSHDAITYRDVGSTPPAPVSEAWIAAAFCPPERRTDTQKALLAESDRLASELVAADLIVIGAPMYNFGVPAQLKAWIDNVVRVGVTFGFDRARTGEPYWPMLPPGKRLVILTARGDFGYDAGGRLAAMNLVEQGLKVPLAYLGLHTSDAIAIEYDEFVDERLASSIATAENNVDRLVEKLLAGLRQESVFASA
ncbi:NAD(P)H dehydrogenase [Agrobacterium vitis]|uniref:FMN dependent NADH:quinone oxidoreductase n=1 Tax=Agrobacterium vitis TaxID=373 RepID=A0AAE4WES6_AGRVI|nr:NAD(P)H-dependent oxidoreductase [Agrobacterium vitis]MCF1499330.1 NAD(P)H dehydrogenase [Allorhizobium sp. Av2]MCM2439419.1 NAD(P)H dehydrogenase [Agrobacterium vitis]MUZ57677.1 NAD(P)H dehydrogenase [Agrobacterium vitis]